jgi:predicted permease
MVLSDSAEKALSMFFVLLVGFFFRNKFQDTMARAGLRTLILTIALPASIFTSILNIHRGFDFITPPFFAIIINLSYLSIIWLLTQFWLTEGELPQKRSLIMIFPSLAPGLTAFPFIEDFIGRDGLAWAAMSDVGNKIFVLFGLYALAVNWGQREMSTWAGDVKDLKSIKRVQTLIITLFSEPINISILLGLILMSLGFNQSNFPSFISDGLSIISGLTTGLILLFVGISFRFKTDEIIAVLSVLLARSGLGFLLSAATIHFSPAAQQEPLLFVVMPQCGCSLWPFLHMIKVEDDLSANLNAEEKHEKLMHLSLKVKAELSNIHYPKIKRVIEDFDKCLKKAGKDPQKLREGLHKLSEELTKAGKDFPKLLDITAEINGTIKEKGENDRTKFPLVFNTNYAMSLLAVSFPFSIGVVLFVFADPNPFQNSLDLTFIGMVFLMLHFIFKQATKQQLESRSAPPPPPPQTQPRPLNKLPQEMQGLSVNELSRKLMSGHRSRSR